MRRPMAGSRLAGRLVVPITSTRAESRVSRPSQCVSHSAWKAAVASWSCCARARKRQSISSTNRSEGARRWATDQMAATRFWDSPYHLESMEDGLTLRKAQPASLAMALANIVLPVPGGPWRSTPLVGRSSLLWARSSGRRSGRSTSSRSCRMSSEWPPMCAKDTSMEAGSTTMDCATSTSSAVIPPTREPNRERRRATSSCRRRRVA
mmetsp:Transcript_4983/g.16704  ORF Transcript_4983/g.16704 Transcript_4983/m.16704 type:complete len:208 (-) Transcript_4983:243-866(-)